MAKIALCGYGYPGCKALERLMNAGHQVEVFTHESPYHVPSLYTYSKKLSVKCNYDSINKSKEFYDAIISIYYRYKINPKLISSVNNKALNLHPSLLPEYKGCSSVTWAIINGEEYSGYTYHLMTENFDDGNILFQEKIKIDPFDTQQILIYKILSGAFNNFDKIVLKLLSGEKGRPQKFGGKYYNRNTPYEGIICETWSEEIIERFIRAMINPPYPYAKYRNKEIRNFEEYLRFKQDNYFK